ncbi:MAG: molybdenum cofactor biosynthesis protein MoaE [Actinobacteria bacterium]|nr:molybdenum cofactor biosynthesis protein MoaE [Actinomycetota bacterium]MCL5446622.1 molybdenum cofactor biosynthesis protein MoaE [Actinomycetota bacterium]
MPERTGEMKQTESMDPIEVMPGTHLHDARGCAEPTEDADDASVNDPEGAPANDSSNDLNDGPDGDWIAIASTPLAVGDVIQWAIQPDCGAVASFLGVTRKESSGMPGQEGVIALDYEAYEQPALDHMRHIASYARERWPDLVRVAILHRIGRVDLCEPSVLIVASSPHRSTALSTVSYIIDAVKSSVPIWKKEMFGTPGTGDASPEAVAPARNDLGMKVQTGIRGDMQAGVAQFEAVSSWASAHPLEDIPRPEEDPAPVQGAASQASPPLQPYPPGREGSPLPEQPGS